MRARLHRALRGAAFAGLLLAVTGALLFAGNALVPSSNSPRAPFSVGGLVRAAVVLGAAGVVYGAVFGAGSRPGTPPGRRRTWGALAGLAGGVGFLAATGLLAQGGSAWWWLLLALQVLICVGLGAWAAPRMEALLADRAEPAV
jgi:hypothetical protein